jgi:protein SCO1/2
MTIAEQHVRFLDTHSPPRRRGRRPPVHLLAALLAAGSLLLLAGCGGGADAASGVPMPSPAVGTAVDFPVPAAIASIPLTTASGTHTTLAAFHGEPVLIADFMTLCNDVCPLISANVAAIARAVQADGYAGKVALLEITIDPRRDSVHRLAAYQKLYGGAVPGWTLLRASPAGTRALWKFFGVGYRRVKEGKPAQIDWLTHKKLTYDLQHTDDVIFLDTSGHERFVIDGSPLVKTTIPIRLRRQLTEQGIQNLKHPQPVADWSVAQGMQVLSWLSDHRLAVPST